MIFSMGTFQVFSKPGLISLKKLATVGLKSAAWRYCASYWLVVWYIMLFSTNSDCCVDRGTSHISVCLIIVPFIFFPFLGLKFLASLM